MKKWGILGLILGILLIIVLIILFANGKKDISMMTDEEFNQVNLKNTELKRTIGYEEIVRTNFEPIRTFNQENLDILSKIRPDCVGKVQIGMAIRTITYYTKTRAIGTIWSLKDNRLICVVSAPDQQ